MRKPMLVILLLSFIITAKAQQANKPTDAVTGQSQTNQETVPEPPGGLDVLMKYMKKYANHNYNNDQAGKVTLSFTVEKDGSLTNYKIVQSLNNEADGIAIQILKDYNKKWKPAMQNGQPIKAEYTISVPFGREY